MDEVVPPDIPPDRPEEIPVVAPPPPRTKPRDGKDLLKNTEFYYVIGILGAVILIGAVVLHFVDRWRKRQDQSECESPLTLSSYREMYENGEITQSEYERIRNKMAARIKKDVGISNPSTGRPSTDRPTDSNGGAGSSEPGKRPDVGSSGTSAEAESEG